MIDRESEIMDAVVAELRNKYDTSIFIINKPLSVAPAVFPAVSIVQESNIISTRYSTFDKIENVVQSTFYIEIYSDVSDDECKEVADVIESVMTGYNYIRTLNTPMVNEDNSYDRRVMRYTNNHLV